MRKPLDISKFRTKLTKSIPGICMDISDPEIWIDTGCYALNYLISGDFKKGIPLGKAVTLAGESGSGKSLLAASIARKAQEQGIFPIFFDSENALDKSWLEALKVDTSEDKLLRVPVSMVDDVAKFISEFMKNYMEQYSDLADDAKPCVLFVVDSLGMLQTPAEVAQFELGDMKGDLGRKAKALTALMRNCSRLLNKHVGIIFTNHTYASQNQYDPDAKIAGGAGIIYASSIIATMQKFKLKEDADGNKTTDVRGIRSKVKVVKSRFNKPFEEVELQVPYAEGLDPYSGMFDLCEKKKLLKREGNRYIYVSPTTGEEIREFRKGFTNDVFDVIISEWQEEKHIPVDLEEDNEE